MGARQDDGVAVSATTSFEPGSRGMTKKSAGSAGRCCSIGPTGSRPPTSKSTSRKVSASSRCHLLHYMRCDHQVQAGCKESAVGGSAAQQESFTRSCRPQGVKSHVQRRYRCPCKFALVLQTVFASERVLGALAGMIPNFPTWLRS